MQVFDLFNTDHERRLAEGAIDQLEQRRIDDLAMKMDDLVKRAKEVKDPAHKAALVREFQKCKAERDSYYKVREAVGQIPSGPVDADPDERMDWDEPPKPGNPVPGEALDEGSMKRWLETQAERMSKEQFVGNAGEYGMSDEEAAEFWDNINFVEEAGIGQDLVNKTEKMARATPQTRTGAVASTVKNAAKWLAGKGGPGREGPTYEGADDVENRGEYDQEGDMAKDNIHTIVRNAKELESILGDNDNLPEWVQDKLANIKGMMTAVSDYMQTQHEREHEAAAGQEGITIAEKLKGLPSKKLGSARDLGKSVRKFRAQRGLEEAGTSDQWSKEGEWKAIPKAKSGKPADPRGEVTHLSDVARREAERKADQKKNSEEVDEGWSDAIVAQRTGRPRTPYSVFINGKKWKDFENDNHAEAVANKLRAKFEQEGKDPSAITIAATDYDKGMKEDDPMGGATVDIDQMAGAVDDTNPGNLGEAGNPAQQAAIAIAMKKAGKKPKQVDEEQKEFLYTVECDGYNKGNFVNKNDAIYSAQYMIYYGEKEYNKIEVIELATGDVIWEWHGTKDDNDVAPTEVEVDESMQGGWIVYDPETRQIKKRFKTHTAGKSYAKTHGLGFASSEYYFDKVKEPAVAEEKTRLDPKCWTGKKIGTPKTKMKGGVRVNNCVPAESVETFESKVQGQGIADAKLLEAARRIDLLSKSFK